MIPYGKQTIEADDLEAVSEVLKSDCLTQGPKVVEFERALADYCGAKHAVVFSNGTTALQAAYFAAGLKEGDEFITSPLTFAATANAGLWQGGRPVFADVDPATGNLDPSAVERAVTARTKVIAPVDYAGRPADLAFFRDLARRKNILIIEDSCHALGASTPAGKVGSVSDMTVFSFHPVKSITTGEGGAVLTHDDGLARRLAAFRTHGITKKHPDWRYEVGELGQNGRLTDIQSALGISQLRKVDRFISARAKIARAYDEDLRGSDGLTLPPIAEDGASAWHLYPLRIKRGCLPGGRSEAFARFHQEGIGVQVHYIPVYLHPLYAHLGYQKGLCPVAELFYEEEISLPIFPSLREEERGRVVEAVRSILGMIRRSRDKGISDR